MRVVGNSKRWINKDQIKRLIRQIERTELHKEFLQNTKYKPKYARNHTVRGN